MEFNAVGIICEYNPFHYGHKYHIEETKRLTGCKNVVCVMSGSMVQRGECAIFDKWQRAKTAIDSGADLVIELPTYYVLQSADTFAYGGIKLLDSLNIIDAVSFGCECNDLTILKKVVEIMTEQQSGYDMALKKEMQKGLAYPKASENALLECGAECAIDISKPNNTLGVCYLKALKQLKSKIVPVCIKRNNDYHSDSTNDLYMSATEIRKRITENINYSDYANDYSNENIFEIQNAESFILGYLRMVSGEYLARIKGGEDGLANLIKNSAAKACTFNELIEMCVSKRYTKHRIKRYILSALLGIDHTEEINYIRVLGIGKNGKELLKKIKQNSDFDIITKVADYKKANKMFEIDIKATDFASLCSADNSKKAAGKDYTTTPYVLKQN